MKTLIIYDKNGNIIQEKEGNYKIPVGIPYIEVEVPTSKYPKSINAETKEVIYDDIPKSETEILDEKISILEAENADLLLDSAIKDSKIQTLENDLADLTLEIAMMEVR